MGLWGFVKGTLKKIVVFLCYAVLILTMFYSVSIGRRIGWW